MPLNAHQRMHRSRGPPAREKFTEEECLALLDSLPVHEPMDPTSEDVSVLALFDELVSQYKRLDYISRDPDDSEPDSSELNYPFLRELPFFYDSDFSYSDTLGSPISTISLSADDSDEQFLNRYEELYLDPIERYLDPVERYWGLNDDEEEGEEEEEKERCRDITDRIVHGFCPEYEYSTSEEDEEDIQAYRDLMRTCRRKRRRVGACVSTDEAELSSVVDSGIIKSGQGDVNEGMVQHSECGSLRSGGEPAASGGAQHMCASPMAGACHTRGRSKRKKLLDLRARCSAGTGSAGDGDFGRKYTADYFLRTKSLRDCSPSSSSSASEDSPCTL